MKRLLVLLAGLSILAPIWQSATQQQPQALVDTCTVPTGVAHRGGYADSGYTENTLLAYTHVWAWGINDWETDIRFDVNGIPYLMHDATLDRTTDGTGNANSINVLTTTIKMNDGQNLKDQTLDKLLALAVLKDATVAIEPKVVATTAQVGQVGLLLNTYDMRDKVLIDSFETTNLAPFKASMTDLTYGLVTSTAVNPADAAAVGPILNIASSAIPNEAAVDAYHAAGLQVYAWTLDEPSEWAPQRFWGIDRYVSNKPIKYRAWRDWVCTGNKWEGQY